MEDNLENLEKLKIDVTDDMNSLVAENPHIPDEKIDRYFASFKAKGRRDWGRAGLWDKRYRGTDCSTTKTSEEKKIDENLEDSNDTS